MTSSYVVTLDACVLVNASIRDALLRLAEHPRLYIPKWSAEIIKEVVRTLQREFGLSSTQTDHLVVELGKYFPDAWVTQYEDLLEVATNDPKDRHVLAAAIKSGSQTIVTFNLKHFRKEDLVRWDIEAQHPDEFLVHQYHLDPSLVVYRMNEQALGINKDLPGLLRIMRPVASRFVRDRRTGFRDRTLSARSRFGWPVVRDHIWSHMTLHGRPVHACSRCRCGNV